MQCNASSADANLKNAKYHYFLRKIDHTSDQIWDENSAEAWAGGRVTFSHVRNTFTKRPIPVSSVLRRCSGRGLWTTGAFTGRSQGRGILLLL